MCFRNLQGDLPDNLVSPPIRVIGADPPSSPQASRQEASKPSLDTANDRQSAAPHNASRSIAPGVKASTASTAPAPQEDKRKHERAKPSWSDLFRVGGPPLQSYERDINANRAKRDAAGRKRLQDRLDDESFQRERKKSGGVDWGEKGVW
ncbi:hypothetical protein MMC32_001748 [Xylographa parallela]|nr:hypothetical protein [Xylographa parallela]